MTRLHSKPVATSEEVGTNERRDEENAMASQWLYSRDGTEHGPVSSSEVMELAKNGQLLPTDFLWKEGMAEWKPASGFPKLFTLEATPDEMPVFVVTDSKPKTAHQSGGGTAKKSASPTRASSKKEQGLDPFLVGLAIFFVAPLGLYLLWRHPVLKHRTKWWLSACGWLLFLVVVGASSDENNSRSGDQAEGSSGGSVGGNDTTDNLEGCPRGASAEYKDGYWRMISIAKNFDRERKEFRARVDKAEKVSQSFLEDQLVSGTEKHRSYLLEQLAKADQACKATPSEFWQGYADGCRYALRYILKRSY